MAVDEYTVVPSSMNSGSHGHIGTVTQTVCKERDVKFLWDMMGKSPQQSTLMDAGAVLKGRRVDEQVKGIAKGLASLVLEAMVGLPSSANIHPDLP